MRTARSNWCAVTLLLSIVACAGGQSTDSQTSSPSPTFTDAPDLSAQSTENSNPTVPPNQRMNVPAINASVQRLMSEYSALRERAVNIVAGIADGESNTTVLQDDGSTWYTDERAFQSHIDALPVSLTELPQYMDVKGNLAEAEEFLYSAGADAMSSCNATNARRELKVADYFFNAVKREIATGTSSPDDTASPPQVDSAPEECPQQ